MLMLMLAGVVGILAGMLSALPGLHVSILLIGALPLLGVSGPAGAVALVAAIGSGLISTNLAKTFHPVTSATVDSATPEQLMAYQGRGLKAVFIQNQAVWAGTLTVLALALIALPIRYLTGPSFESGLDTLADVITLPLLILFVVLVVWQAKHRWATIAVIVLGTLLGFYTFNCAGLRGNPNVLAPLLGGGFALPALFMVVATVGGVQPFPEQRATTSKLQPAPEQIWGALAGISTALTAGLGSGGAVSMFADSVTHEKYLGMATASETANNTFAILLFVLVGSTHSGAGVALKRQLQQPDLVTSLLLFVTLLLAVFAATQLSNFIARRYAYAVACLPQKGTAAFIACVTLLLIYSETGTTGIAVALAAGALGWCAKINFVPNQAIVSVLTGPVLVYHLGLAGWLASVLGVLH